MFPYFLWGSEGRVVRSDPLLALSPFFDDFEKKNTLRIFPFFFFFITDDKIQNEYEEIRRVTDHRTLKREQRSVRISTKKTNKRKMFNSCLQSLS